MHAVLLVEQNRRGGCESAFLDPGEQALADDVLGTRLSDTDQLWLTAMSTVPAAAVARRDDLLLGFGHDGLQLHRVTDQDHAFAARQRQQ